MVATKPSRNSGPIRLDRKLSKRSILRGTKTAWIFYCNHRRGELLSENAGLSFGDVCKELAPQWKELSAEQKQPFVDQHLGDKQRYITQLLHLNTEQKKAMKSYKKQRRDVKRLKPKAGLSPYMFFVIAQRHAVVAANPLATFQEVGKLLGTLWNTMSLTERVAYIELGKADKVRYLAEQVEYHQKRAMGIVRQPEPRMADIVADIVCDVVTGVVVDFLAEEALDATGDNASLRMCASSTTTPTPTPTSTTTSSPPPSPPPPPPPSFPPGLPPACPPPTRRCVPVVPGLV